MKISYCFFLHFRKWNFLSLILSMFLYFLKRKLFLYFWKRKPRKNSLYFTKQNISIFQETFYIPGSNFLRSKNEKNLFWRNFFYFKKEHTKPKKPNKKLFFRTTNLLLYPLLLGYSFFSYRAFIKETHDRYLTEFLI